MSNFEHVDIKSRYAYITYGIMYKETLHVWNVIALQILDTCARNVREKKTRYVLVLGIRDIELIKTLFATDKAYHDSCH